MNAVPNKAIIEKVALEFGVNPAFVEKDWYVVQPVSSFIAQLTKNDPEIPVIQCIDPVETAIDKMSALVWRVPDRVREPQDDDLIELH